MSASSLSDELRELQATGLERRLRPLASTGGKPRLDGREYLNFSSNDYLNLANDPRVRRASTEAIGRWGCGATASRLMTGHLDLHAELEARLAAQTGHETALVFGSGFLANTGTLAALAGRDDAIFSDKLNHASLIDGSLMSRSKTFRYRHKDPGHLESLLKKNAVRGRRLIVTDSVFSMDGDIAPLRELDRLARQWDAWLVVDEAHALGVFGPKGEGVCRQEKIDIRPTITLATLGKALGGYGGFVACSEETRSYLVNRARSFIYSTALPPRLPWRGHRGARLPE